MADKTHIEWTEATWNPVTGCSKVSAGCKHCYAERDWARLSVNPKTRYFDRAFTDVQCHEDVLTLPLRWTKPRRIFVNSMSDLFHPDVPFQFVADVFAVMSCTTRHTYQVLTKRPERMLAFFAWLDEERDVFGHPTRVDSLRVWPQWKPTKGGQGGYDNCGPVWPLENVQLGVSVEDQSTADKRITALLLTPAAVRWISAEPLLGPVNLRRLPADTCASECCGMQLLDGLTGLSVCDLSHQAFDDGPRIDWVVVGGESGPSARPMHPAWARSLRDQCAAAGVPFLFKQWGEWCPSAFLPKGTKLPAHRWGWISEKGGPAEINHYGPFKDEFAHHELMGRVGKRTAGRQLDGIEHNGYPEAQS